MEVFLVFLLIVAVCIFVVLYQRGAKQPAESHAAQPPTILEQVSQELEDIKEIIPPPRPKPTLPSKVVFVDVETTGLTDSDRIVSFAAILLEKQSLRTGKLTVSVIHVATPERRAIRERNRYMASQIGYYVTKTRSVNMPEKLHRYWTKRI